MANGDNKTKNILLNETLLFSKKFKKDIRCTFY